ncbi:hypothetical protein UFOVP1422_65 [uncultured Caudovirales phage]|uniref:Uncharacterized protein n=1 Tax=uncultured Caudovirales phage TaxID=2100421 RepID=A0A6J5RVV7_9CAUD|nr:hypothetical protein UFOVP1306_63 [uncultured Caudovirales phage]CAB4210634.1 hypothetical protein UFOVP1422_65 [uncultured Caudovirales phage]
MTRKEEAFHAAFVFYRKAFSDASDAYYSAEANGDTEACEAAEQALNDAEADYEAEVARINEEYPQ